MSTLKKISLLILIVGYIAAGLNHFRVPAFYEGIIPLYIPDPKLVNAAAGVLEILCGLLLIFPKTRWYGAWGIIVLLILFLPVHIDMLKGHTEVNGKIVTPVWAWLRLFLQPVLILWAWWHSKEPTDDGS
jgi:uncharacterized membrane protein